MIYGYACNYINKLVDETGDVLDLGNADIETQKNALSELGVENILTEEADDKKPVLKKLLKLLTDEDCLVVYKTLVLGSSRAEVTKVKERLKNKGVLLKDASLEKITNVDPKEKFESIAKIINAINQSNGELPEEERLPLSGISTRLAKMLFPEGPFSGRYSYDQLDYALHLLKTKTYDETAKITGISKSTISRYKKLVKDGKNVKA